MKTKNDIQRILQFITNFSGSERTFLNGCCYWFAYILHTMFDLDIGYEPVEGHFVASCIIAEPNNDGTTYSVRRFDVRGDVTQLFAGKDIYDIEWLKSNEPNWYKHLMRDCRDFIRPSDEELAVAV